MLTKNIEAKTENGNGNAPVPLFSEAGTADVRRARAWLKDRLLKSKGLPPSELLSEVVTVTPALAEIILAECNRGNRTIRKKRVENWTDAIREGRWKLTSQGISFSRDGFLNDGQHRLTAIAQSGKAVQMLVVFGEDRDVFDVLDTGANRGGSDALHVAGYKNTTTLSAAARLLRMVTSDEPVGSVSSFPNDIIKATVEEHPRLEDASTPGHRIGRKLKCSTAATTVAFYLIGEHSAHSRRLEFFIERLSDGAGLRRKDPILTLRDGLKGGSDFKIRQAAGSAIRQCAAIVLAWNKWVHGTTATTASLKWLPGDSFPKPE